MTQRSGDGDGDDVAVLGRVLGRFRARGGDGGWVAGPAMSIVAHPDDDLYFINPAIGVAIAARVPAVGVVINSAEGDGRNVDVNDPRRAQAPVDHAGYATARHVGLRRAYARMAGLPVGSAWRQEAVTLAGGLVVERDELEDRPDVVLYFFNIAHREVDGRKRYTVPPLVDGQIQEGPTMPALDLATPVQSVTKEMLVASLAELIDRHRPTVVRTLDPDPEHDWGAEKLVASDHVEHTAAARLAIEAVRRIGATWPVPPLVEYHRGYTNRYWPANLSPRLRDEKATFLATYAGADGAPDPGLPYGHGDYQLGTNPYRSTHMNTMASRYVATSTWLTTLPSGDLVAYAVLGDRLARWDSAGGWHGPALGVDGLMPTLAVAGPHVFALRRTDTVEVGYVTAGSDEWHSLGGPDAGHTDRRRAREIGVPAAVLDARGDLWLFVRDFSGGLSMRRRLAGEWQPWEAVGPGPLQDVPAASLTTEGLVQVYAAAKHTVLHWRQAKPGGPLEPGDGLRTRPVASGGLTAVRTADDRACLLYREGTKTSERETSEKTSRIRSYAEQPGTWPTAPEGLGGADGFGPIAALPQAGDLLMAQRNRFWTVSVAVPPTPSEGSPWRRLPGLISGAPALATGASGRAVLAALGLDGHLHVAHQQKSGDFGPWTTV